ncbi:hypothetical protein HK097_010121 [Rhizophlyctis rosea]|uniref:Uncharacterized protein n=1 Tax=Rhizophlyctis rosea TaxID=64517 RepID=A0AAD5X0N3_9FUNG|nr:hypothetical protein HK097_010121 [Rhizophlyctis rosea]
MSTKITFTSTPHLINTHPLIHLPKPTSALLPARGLVVCSILIPSLSPKPFIAPLEPDGKKSHFFLIDSDTFPDIPSDQSLSITLTPLKKYPAPPLPSDIHEAFRLSNTLDLYYKCTPASQYDWIRWIRSTKNEETRRKRIEVAIDKLGKGSRRPCCFNRSLCTVMEVSKGGVLLGGDETAELEVNAVEDGREGVEYAIEDGGDEDGVKGTDRGGRKRRGGAMGEEERDVQGNGSSNVRKKRRGGKAGKGEGSPVAIAVKSGKPARQIRNSQEAQ